MKMNYNEITPRIVLGACPFDPTEVDRMQAKTGISAVLNVQTDEDFSLWGVDWPILEDHYHRTGIVIRREPVLDFRPDELRRGLPRCIRALDELIRGDHKVYVHCTAGINRSPSVVITYLHWYENLPLPEAIEFVKSRRRHSDPYYESIQGAIEDMKMEE